MKRETQPQLYKLHRFRMLTRWLTVTALLAGSANPQRPATGQDSLSVAPTCRVQGHLEVQLTLKCGDEKNGGVVQYWHTPFGELQRHGFQSKLDPVFMHHDGSLVIPNSSLLHSGLYYCLLQHTEGTTLWPYELHVGHNLQKNQEQDEYEQSGSCAMITLSQDIGSEGEKEAGVSDAEFAGAVAASVLLTFVLGFSTGALTRTYVLRCLGAVTKRLRSPRQQTDMVDSGSQVAMPPMSQAFEMGQVQDDNSINCASTDTSTLSTASSPPAKPQRSLKHKLEKQETAVFLKGCDYRKEEERKMEEEEAGTSVEKNKKCEGGEEVDREGEGSKSETDGEKCSEDREEKDGGQSREEKKEQDEEEEANKSKDDEEQNRGREAAAGGDKEKTRGDEKREEEGGWRDEKERDDGEKVRTEDDICRDSRDSQNSSTETEDDETDGKTQENAMKNSNIESSGGKEAALSSPPRPARRSRVIRLYQYDEDGQRYGHLPDPDDAGPIPRPRQRSASLKRLNAIMAAASAGPLEKQETGKEEKEEQEERTHFHMDI